MWFIFGFFLGSLVGLIFFFLNRRDVAGLVEEKDMLQQEKSIVVGFMHEMVESLGDGLDRQSLFERIAYSSIASTNALSSAVYELQQGGHLKTVAVEGLFPPQHKMSNALSSKAVTRAKYLERILKSEDFKVGEGVIGMVAQNRKGLLIRDAENDPQVVHHSDPSLRLRTLIVVPIEFQKQLIGVLAVANRTDGMGFDETDFSLVQSIGEQAGLALQNHDLVHLERERQKLDTDLELAGNIQLMLLPSELPSVEGLQIDAVYRPAQKIGGDLYDAVQLSENRVGVAIADVSGKGIPASMIMAMCHCNFRHYCHQYDSPAEVMRALNASIANDIREDMFITVVYAVVDLEAETITIARAGHEDPIRIWKQADGAGELSWGKVHGEGMAVGLVPPEMFEDFIEEVTLPFLPGDVFILYTDGITEAVSKQHEEYSAQRLGNVGMTLADRPAKQINAGILESVARYAGTQGQTDDITLMTIKRS